MYKTPDYIKAYYMLDRTDDSVHKFYTKTELYNHIKAMSNPYRFGKTTLSYIEEGQNFTDTDVTVYRRTELINHHYIPTIHSIVLKPYTFYYESINGDLHIFDIRTLHNEIIKHVYVRPNYNWCQEKHWKPYQIKHRHGKPNRYAYIFDEETNEYLSNHSHNKMTHNENKRYFKWVSSSERSWKKQSKKRRQYGNNTRDKYLESDFFDIDDDLYLCS